MNIKLMWALVIVGVVCIGLGVYSLFVKSARTEETTSKVNAPNPALWKKTVEVPANVLWVDTGLDVTNKVVRIEYKSGEWSNGGADPYFYDAKGVKPEPGDGQKLLPYLLCRNAVLCELIGKTNSGIFSVGLYREINAGQGELYLSINDKPDSFNDNLGRLMVDVSVIESASYTKQIQIPARAVWFDTGIDLAGQKVRIEYVSGQWSNTSDNPIYSDGNSNTNPWPGLLVSNLPLRALIGKTDNQTFFVGSRKDGNLGSGRLYLCMNDVVGKYDDNIGSLTVLVSIFE